MYDLLEEVRHLLIGIWRQRWFVVGITWCAFAAGAVFVSSMPSTYETHAKVYADTRSLLGPLLRGIAVETDLGQQVQVMRQTLLSRPNLERVARSTDLDLNVSNAAEMEALINEISVKASIKAEANNIFIVSYRDTDPQRARDVVQSLLTIFVENNLGENRTEMETAQAFLTRQINEYEAKLSDTETKIANFRAEHGDVVVGGNYAGRLESARSGLKEAKFSYDDALVRYRQLKAQLDKTPEFVNATQSPLLFGDQAMLSTADRIRQLTVTLDELKMRYTDQHPDVIAAKRRLEILWERYRREQAGDVEHPESAGTARMPNPVYEQLKLRTIDAEGDLKLAERHLQVAEERLAAVEANAAEAPALDAELRALNRDYGVMRQKYDELVTRREAARIAQAVDIDASSVKFRIIEPAVVPQMPAGPDRPLYLTAALFAALGAGLGYGVLRTQVDRSFWSVRSLQSTFSVPVIGSVGLNPSLGGRRSSPLGVGVFSAVVALLIVTYVALVGIMPMGGLPRLGSALFGTLVG